VLNKHSMNEKIFGRGENKGKDPTGVEVKTAADFKNKEEILAEVMRVEREAWPEEIQATREKFESRLNLFPEGFFLAFVDGRLGGVSTSEIISLDSAESLASWEEVTDNGFIKKTHDGKGNALYVVSVGVSKLMQGKGLGSALVEAQKSLVKRKGLEFLVLGARLPGYRSFHSSHPEVAAEEYAKLKNKEGEALDLEE
jgi:GNAT superfamily N-acetyltransferase